MSNPSSQPQGSTPRRCTDEERQRTAVVLSDALSKGQLTMAEFDERTAACFAATDRTELSALLSDLVDNPDSYIHSQLVPTGDNTPATGAQNSQALSPAQAAIRRALSRVTGEPGSSSLTLGIFGGSERRSWVVPESHTSLAAFGGNTLDLTSAHFTSQHSTISANAFFGGIEIKVPEGVRVHVDGVGIFGGYSTRVKSGAIDPSTLPPSAPTIRITGLALFGGVDIQVIPTS